MVGEKEGYWTTEKANLIDPASLAGMWASYFRISLFECVQLVLEGPI